ncbi:hypothetical protein [Paraburkholderia unamae]|uniref:hypothetical protein n=1 Tax=Paraburkholderia unamae TaxID=219649 RepID=UPI001057C426|nr:hypothetical protein [Paraburkholderia unamae]
MLRMIDLRHVETGLSEREKREAVEECQRLRQREQLGTRHLLHPANAPRKGVYNPLTGARLS